MKPHTEKQLERLREATWFAKVGTPDKEYILLSSWSDAISHAGGENWERTIQDAVNHIWALLDRVDGRRGHEWNDIVADITKDAKRIVDAKIQLPNTPFDGKKEAILSLVHIVLCSCMELEFADISLPNFFQNLATLLKQGRFPCGWSGEYPDGQLIIY